MLIGQGLLLAHYHGRPEADWAPVEAGPQTGSHNLRNTMTDFKVAIEKFSKGAKMLSFREAKLWNSLPAESKTDPPSMVLRNQ